MAAAAFRDQGTATVAVDGEPVTLGPAEVVVTETPREGWTAHRIGPSLGLTFWLREA